MPIKIKGSVKEKGPGFKKLYDQLGGIGTITLGVQGKEAKEKHSNSELTVGQIAAIHELGLGVPKRSWLVAWLDKNQTKMLAAARRAMVQVASGKKSRKKALQELGQDWVEQLQENIDFRGVDGPPLSETQKKRKGHGIPLLETGDLRDAITYKLYLPRFKNVPGGSAKAAAKAAIGSGEVDSPQGKKRPRMRRKSDSLESLMNKARKVNGIKAPSRRGRVRQAKFSRGLKKLPKVKAAQYRAVERARIRYLKAEARRFRAARALTKSGGAKIRSVSRPSGSIYKFLVRMAKKALRKSIQGGSASYRNHGFTRSGRGGRTGRAGFWSR